MALTILLIDTDAQRGKALEEALCGAGFADVVRLPEGADLVAAVEQSHPDVVIIDMALPDRDALEDIRAVSAQRSIVMFSDSDDPSFVEEAIAAGVCSYNLSGVASQDIKPIMSSAVALFRRYAHVERELAAAQAQLMERRQIERAKASLMRGHKMTEPEAYRWLQRKAMNENRKLVQVVADVLAQEDRDDRKA